MVKNIITLKKIAAMCALGLSLNASGWSQCPFEEEVDSSALSRSCSLSPNHSLSQEEKWWTDFTTSGKEIVSYVYRLADYDPKGAAWFLLTGGKEGFSSRVPNDYEQKLLIATLNKIVLSFLKREKENDESLQSLEDWLPIKEIGIQGKENLGQMKLRIHEIEESVQTCISGTNYKFKSVFEERHREVQLKIDTLPKDDNFMPTAYRFLVNELNETTENLRQHYTSLLSLVDRSFQNLSETEYSEGVGTGLDVMKYILEEALARAELAGKELLFKIRENVQECIEKVERKLHLLPRK